MSKGRFLLESAARGLAKGGRLPSRQVLAPSSQVLAPSSRSLAKHAQVRLDRERDRELPTFRYEIVTPDQLDQAKELLYASYHPFEPLTKHLGLFNGSNNIPDMDALVEQTISENLSLFARDESGKVMGVCINGVSRREDWSLSVNEIPNFTDPKARPLAAIRQELHNKGVKIFDEVGTDAMFGIKMVGVDPSLRGKGMSTNMIRRSVLLAGCLGFEGLKAEATAEYAQVAFQVIGFSPVLSINYEDFEYEGERVFAGIPGETGLVLYQKKFFQNCLKHIV